MNNSTPKKQTIGILGYGEIGKAMAKIGKEANYDIFVREVDYDQIQKNKIDYLHINIPEINPDSFINIITKNILDIKPRLVIINSTTTTGTTRKIYEATNVPIVHSPIQGTHSDLYNSIKNYFPKIVGPIDLLSLKMAKKHFKDLKLKMEIFDSAEDSESAKLLDLTYYAWNIIFCKWVSEICEKLGLNFDQVYTKYNLIYNQGYSKIMPGVHNVTSYKGYRKSLPKVIRPILLPIKGPISGHCTIPDVIMFDKLINNDFTKFILKENQRYTTEINKEKIKKPSKKR
ncbi:MAG: hypothetical protein PHQ59_02695 [Candidatus Daviesbacteria bacterium]|nr:hypothetical protein [Candidatus Daviesbacteria bacterium]